MRRAELVERVGGLEAEAEWSHVLSLGEQQRVAFLRLLLHAPKLAFLDEATGALDSATEAALYTRLRSYCTSYISVGGWLTAAARLQDIHCFTDLHMGPWAWHAAMSSQVHVRRWPASYGGCFLGCRAQDGAAAVPHACAGARGRHQVAAEHCGGVPGEAGCPIAVQADTAVLVTSGLQQRWSAADMTKSRHLVTQAHEMSTQVQSMSF